MMLAMEKVPRRRICASSYLSPVSAEMGPLKHAHLSRVSAVIRTRRSPISLTRTEFIDGLNIVSIRARHVEATNRIDEIDPRQ